MLYIAFINYFLARDIVNKKKSGDIAPTPNNTPISAAPLSGSVKPSLPSLAEGEEAYAGPSPDLVNLIQGRFNSLIGKSSGYVESLPEEVQNRINGLHSLQAKHNELEVQFNKDIFELEKKYLSLYTPLYVERELIINGKREPTSEEVETGKAYREKDEEAEEVNYISDDEESPAPAQSEEKLEGIPDFWLTVLKNHPKISEYITENDEKALKYLRNISVEHLTEEPGFQLTFTFEKNEYFTNETLTKTYFYDQSSDFGDYIFHRTAGCTINWVEGNDLTHKTVEKKQVNKRTNETRIVKKDEPIDSFFDYFANMQFPSDDDDELDQEDRQALADLVEADYEMGEEFKNKLIPHAIHWFTGKAILEYGEEGFDGNFNFFGNPHEHGEHCDHDHDDEDDEDDEEDL
ncbi:NAP-domain-containing protein [Conidiobolus coronatus NRRL 28638]|uniref:NAP-domain-containing protein n=1 Tax=Conidiobolus coronatus (strain ATCC 28846 / CBS 209.66 / NRRL 28638) TaxID=796925 RepID=A0A137NTA1_CONC2|nr:NAP-domain-containing protein [Conidiobolus coronatus NRRL 28638]|eukprot:KXN66025.1 NAP-domain-containing protein [Conidiobolus coronatus NRRL 28638]